VGLVFLVNAFDQDIRPEARAFADFSIEQVPPERNAYFAVLGHNAAALDDPHRKGMEIAATHNERVATATAAKKFDPTIISIPDLVLGPNKLQFKGDASKLCDHKAQSCFAEYNQKAPMIERLWAGNHKLIERYFRLYDYPHYREVASDSFYFLVVSGDHQTYSLIRAEIGLKAIRGNVRPALEALRRDMRYQRMVLRECRTLISKMIAAARVKRNLALLSEIIATTRLGNREQLIAKEILTPFDQTELDISRVFRSELGSIRYSFEATSDWFSSDQEPTENPWWSGIANVFFKKNATINLMYERNLGLAELARLPPDKLVVELASGRADNNFQNQWLSWHTAYNPIGKFTAAMVTVDTWMQYIARVRNVDALNRLVSLQLTAKQKGLNDQQLSEFLAQADHTLSNPYTSEPPRWDAESRTIYFLCLRERANTDSELMGQKVEVFLQPNRKLSKRSPDGGRRP
jgi:hypothetical protein